MPESANEHLDFLRNRIRETRPDTILDVGMGRGNYGWFLRNDVAWRGRLVGLEVWGPYVLGPDALAGGNTSYYDRIVVGDVRFNEDLIRQLSPDTVFAFDVIEHMPYGEGATVMAMLRKHCKKELLVSVPIVVYPQGELHGNPYEKHLHDWTVDEMAFEGGRLVGKGAATGLFAFTPTAVSAVPLTTVG